MGEIALRVGFDDPAYFARFFRRQTGVTPSDHRSRAREQQTAAGKTAAA
ncbi:MAG: helix-turn-helix domain-containing protein [Steroidobacteraceae bacterium]